MNHPDDDVIHELRRRATAGAGVPQLLGYLWGRLGDEAAYSSNVAKYFGKAFRLPLRAVTRVGGWRPDSRGSISDQAIIDAMNPPMLETKSQWKLE